MEKIAKIHLIAELKLLVEELEGKHTETTIGEMEQLVKSVIEKLKYLRFR